MTTTISIHRRVVMFTVILALFVTVVGGAINPNRADAASTTYEPQLQSMRCIGASGGGTLGKRAIVYPGMMWFSGQQVPQYLTSSMFLPNPTSYIEVALVSQQGRTVYRSGWVRFDPTSLNIFNGALYKVYVQTAWRDPGHGNKWAYNGWKYVGTC